MSQNKGSWYDYAGMGVVVASVSAVSMLFLNHKKIEQQKILTETDKKQIKQQTNQKSEEKIKHNQQANPKSKEEETNQAELIKPISSQQNESEILSTAEKRKNQVSSPKEKSSQASSLPQPHSKKDEDKDRLLSILKELHNGMTITIQRVSQDPIFHRPEVSEEEMTANLQKYFQNRIGKIRAAVYKQHNISDEQFNQILEKYKEDKEVGKMCVRIARVNKALHIKQDPLTEAEINQIPASLTVDRLIEMMNEMNKGMYQMQMQFMKESQTSQTEPKLFQQQCQQKMTQFQIKIFEVYEVDEDIIAFAMQKYTADPKLQNAIMKMQQQQPPQ